MIEPTTTRQTYAPAANINFTGMKFFRGMKHNVTQLRSLRCVCFLQGTDRRQIKATDEQTDKQTNR